MKTTKELKELFVSGEKDELLRDIYIDEALLDYLVKKSYSVTYGARNLRRQIQKDLEDNIATKLIDSYLRPISAIHASADGEHPVITAE